MNNPKHSGKEIERKRCFIGNDLEIEDFDKEIFEDMTGLSFDKSFDIIVTSAYSKPKEAFEAILNSDEIWISTAFIGPSFDLLKQMTDTALEHNVRNKLIVNLRPPNRIYNFLPDTYQEQLLANNIEFMYAQNY